MAFNLPRFIAIRTTTFPGHGHLYYNESGSSVSLGESSVFSTLVKIEVERATSNANFVHLRFCHSNRYWSRRANSNVIIAELNKPVEDTKDPSCTLFQPLQVSGQPAGVFFFNHVPTGGRLWVDDMANWGVFVWENPPAWPGHLTFVDWSTLVKLPGHVAFRGDNNRYLRGVSQDGLNYLQFSSNDANELASSHRVLLMSGGQLRITSDHWGGRFWRRSPNWIWADATDQSSLFSSDAQFWPVRVNNTTIGLRNEGNGQFCSRLTAQGKTSMLNAAVRTITTEARLVVQELVSQRNIYNVRYRMENARIFNEMPFLAGSSVVTNTTDQEATSLVEITYQDERSYSFSRSLSLTAGVETRIRTGVPFIVEGEITMSFEINTTLQWDTATTTTRSVMGSGSVPVPARTTARIDYVGTRGTCDIPFSYTQQDTNSTNGQISHTDQIDGIYKGVSCYNFNFVIRSTQRLA
ncbi:uncharacterized protein LOC125208415 [Salvia hispanica]|uniref:uncharacterized protein LOC125208415 n=1 Tax=Salvia hispanica TaxID=49212 RepID=UPI0020096159|nr:uncharacterized protein LOC125208415 [Salvia hispanica]